MSWYHARLPRRHDAGRVGAVAWWLGAAGLAGLAGLIAYATVIEPRRVARTFLRVVIPGLMRAQRFLVIADLHLRADSHLTFGHVRVAAAWAADEGATGALLLGDIIERDHEVSVVAARLAEALRPMRALYVSGNHELDRARVQWPLRPNDAELIRRGFAEQGIECMDDRDLGSDELTLVGIPWRGWNPRRHSPGTTALRRRSGFAIVVTHSPDHVDASDGSTSFALCGHTHGGQVRLPIIGAPWTPVARPLPALSGLMTIEGTPTYITRGLSATYPIRFRSVPEVVLVEFTPARGEQPSGADVVEYVFR